LEKIPEGSTVLLSTIPDFYIDFPKNGRVRFFEYPPYLPQNAQDEEFMNGIDIIIFNTQFPHLLHYIKSNAQRIIVVPFPQGLIGYIGYLRSKEERIKVSR
jgi:hypothetical protein